MQRDKPSRCVSDDNDDSSGGGGVRMRERRCRRPHGGL